MSTLPTNNIAYTIHNSIALILCIDHLNDYVFTMLLSATKLRRLCFYTCLSVHRGVCLSACWDTNPRSRHPPREQAPPRAGTPGTRPPIPQADHYGCGRCASYWNAFLFEIFSLGRLEDVSTNEYEIMLAVFNYKVFDLTLWSDAVCKEKFCVVSSPT